MNSIAIQCGVIAGGLGILSLFATKPGLIVAAAIVAACAAFAAGYYYATKDRCIEECTPPPVSMDPF